jgi:hypothetical protein
LERQNCWEFFKCGREIGGSKIEELGVCPAATDTSADGLNRGINGGRICWAVAGTLCDGEVQGTMAEKHLICSICEFYKKVRSEEGFFEYRILKPEQL